MIYTVTFNPAIDYVVRLDAPLEIGQVNRACGEDCVLGGKGINVSGVLAQLGCPSVALGFVAGETGAWLERGLAAQGLHTDFVHLENGMTRINVKIKAGQETELNGAGPDIPDEALHQLEEKLDSLTENDVLILAGSIPASLPQNVYERLLARLDGRGVRCVVDATRALLVNVLPYHPFLIKPNNHEVGRIFKADPMPETPEDCLPYAQKLQEGGARNVIVSCGGNGSLLLDEYGTEHIVPTARVRLVNATGAGDSMVAGFLAKVTRGLDYENALIYASACGTATAASKGIAKRSTIDRVVTALYKKMGREMPASIADDIKNEKARAEAQALAAEGNDEEKQSPEGE